MNSWDEPLAPVDAVVFRDACIELLGYAHDWQKQHKEKFQWHLGGPLFLMEYFSTSGEDALSKQLYFLSAMRLMAFIDLIARKKVELTDFLRPTDVPKVIEIHTAILEAVAVAPLRNGEFDIEDILAEAQARTKEIDALDALLGGSWPD